MPDAKPLSPKLQIWLDHIKAAESSGQSLAQYAKNNNLALKNLYNARSTLRKRGYLDTKDAPAFVRAQFDSRRTDVISSQLRVSILFENGIQCQVTSSFDHLDQLLGRVKSL